MAGRLNTNWNFDTLAEATATSGPVDGDVITTNDGHAYHTTPDGRRYPHGPRRSVAQHPAGSNLLAATVNVTNPGAYVCDLTLTLFDEVSGADARVIGYRLFGYKSASGGLVDLAPAQVLFDHVAGAGSGWALSLLTQTIRWAVFLTHSHPNPVTVGVTTRFSGTRWDGQ